MRLRESRKQAGRILLALVAVLLLGSAPALAAGRPVGGNALDWAWGWVRSLWEAVDNGMSIDPNGLTVSSQSGTPQATADEGMCIDPNGLAVSSPSGTPQATADNSMHIDPNG